jgi:hypothetical protein
MVLDVPGGLTQIEKVLLEHHSLVVQIEGIYA